MARVRTLMAVDTAAVLLLDHSRRFLVATAAQGIEEEVSQGVRIPIGKGFAGRIAEQKHWVSIAQVDHGNVLNPILGQKGITSLLGVPLLTAGAVLGVLHVGTLSRRQFTEQDAALLQLVADRVASAAQSRLAQAESTAAEVMRRNLLPATLPQVGGLEFASRYVPGARGAVGGDWYDVFTLPSGTMCFVVGDVVGHGLAAALSMSEVRVALRSAALTSEDPAALLARLDDYPGRAISSTTSASRSAASGTPTDFAAAAAAASLSGAARAARRISASRSGVNSFCGTTIAPPDSASAAAFAA